MGYRTRATARPGAAALLALALLATAACGSAGSAQDTTAPSELHASASGPAAPTEDITESSTATEPTTTEPTTTEPTTTEPTTTEPTEPSTEPPVATRTSHVYYVIDARGGLRLARELRDLPAAEPAQAAVAAMIAGAQDPDYTSTWNPDTEVLGVDVTADLITVNLSGAARTANVGSPGAAMMIQQLIWTVTELAGQPDTPVRLEIDGEGAGELWGAVSWEAPIAREEPTAIRTLVQIDTPREGVETASPVTVSGDAAAFEANVPWRILDDAGAVVVSGQATTSEGMTFAPYTFDVDLPPGSYTVEVREDDPSDGAAGPPTTDTRRFTITG